MKTTIIANLTEVLPVEVKETYKSQRITLMVQEFDRETGDPKPPEIFQPVIFNKFVDSINAKSLEGKRVKATCWIRSLKNEKDGKTFHNLALNCSALIAV